MVMDLSTLLIPRALLLTWHHPLNLLIAGAGIQDMRRLRLAEMSPLCPPQKIILLALN
jgi:hypothetical protein